MDPEEEMRKLAEEASRDADGVVEDIDGDSGHVSHRDMKSRDR
jgi:hypothetical protein